MAVSPQKVTAGITLMALQLLMNATQQRDVIKIIVINLLVLTALVPPKVERKALGIPLSQWVALILHGLLLSLYIVYFTFSFIL